jgi:hypothetical protein
MTLQEAMKEDNKAVKKEDGRDIHAPEFVRGEKVEALTEK